MAGLFKIRPVDKSTITLDVLDNIGTSEYLLMSQDLKEADREKVLYSEGEIDGSVIGSKMSIIDATFVILVNGTSESNVVENMRALQAAFSTSKGGYVEYRPVGYEDAILTTWYKFLKSPPPRRLDDSVIQQASNSNFSLSVSYEFTVKIFALATSEPSQTLAIIESGTVYTYTQSAELGYLILDESDIKGDGLLPLITFEGANANSRSAAIVAFYEMKSGFADADWYSPSPEMAFGVSFDAVDGFYTASGLATWYVHFEIQAGSRAAHGRCVPILSYSNTSNITEEWQARLIHTRQIATSTYLPLTDWYDMPLTTLSRWEVLTMGSVNIPPTPFPDDIPLSNLDSRIGFEVREKNSTAGNIRVFGLLLAPLDNRGWIAKFNSTDLWASDAITNDQWLSINVMAGFHYRSSGSNPQIPFISHAWEKQGMSVRQGIMPKGTYQIRVMCDIEGGGGYGWIHNGPGYDNAVNLKIQGLFYTIYPFSET